MDLPLEKSCIGLLILLFASCSSIPVDKPEEACRLTASRLKDGRPESAMAMAEAARAWWPEHEGVACAWARVALNKALSGEVTNHDLLDEIEVVLRRAAKKGGVEPLYVLGLVQRRRGDLDGALRIWELAWRRDPGHSQALKALADLYYDLGRERSAARFYKELGRIPPPRAQDCYRLALCNAIKVGSGPEPSVADYAKADVKGLLDRALELDEKHVGALQARAWLVVRFSRLRNRWAEQEFRVEDAEQARVYLRKGLAINPHNASLHHAMGWLDEQCGKVSAGEKQYRRALKEDPDFAPALADLAELLEKKGSPPAEVQRLRQRARDHTGDPQLLRALDQVMGAR